MSTPIKRIEKDFLLKVLHDEQLPILYFRNRTEYVLILENSANGQLFLKADKPITGAKTLKKIDLMFNYWNQIITFSAAVNSIKDGIIIADEPEFLYKNLDRSFSRVSTPSDMEVRFTFLGDRYSLAYPKVLDYERGESGDLMNSLNPKNLNVLIGQMAAWIKSHASSYKLVIFKDVKPATTEERVVAETGKTLYLPSTQENLPTSDPYPQKRLITDDMFKQYLESNGTDFQRLDEAAIRFIKAKFDNGIFSDAWVPILFQEYVIGYIHIWINSQGIPPFDYNVIDTLYQFAKILAYSLKINGFFESGKLKNDPFGGKVIDISASGLLFAYPHSPLSTALLPDSELSVKLLTSRRSITTKAKIVRRYRDHTQGYFGCCFLDMAPEDLRFLFEFIYGKPFTDADASFLAGRV
jgi:hypothetical protein